MNVIRKICFMIAITTNLLLVSCVSNNENLDLVIPEKDRTADNFNPTTSRSAIKDGIVVKENTTDDKHHKQNIIEDSDYVEYNSSKHKYYTNMTDSKNTTSLKPKVKEKIVSAISTPNNDRKNTVEPEKKVIVLVDPVKNDIKKDPEIPNDNKPEIIQPSIEKDPPNKDEIAILCRDAWFDESKPCDYIPDNLKSVDELGRSVPHFFTSKEAWIWGEKQIEDEDSEYGCRGFSRMDGYQNDGTQFFFAYLKVCDLN